MKSKIKSLNRKEQQTNIVFEMDNKTSKSIIKFKYLSYLF